jgi:hypothetical protein
MAKTPSQDVGHLKTPDDIIVVLRAIAASDCIIIGGQAINIWSILLEKKGQEPWISNQPYTSIDADGFGDLASLVKLATALQKEGYTVDVKPAEPPDQTKINTGLVLATCLIELPQDIPQETRQDKKHLILAIANFNVYLTKLASEDSAGATRLSD